MRKNKKGMEFLSNLVGYFFLVLITVIFWIIASHIKSELINNTAREVAIDNSQTDLLLFLREPINHGFEQLPVSELIIRSEFEKDKELKLGEVIKDTFDGKYGEYWSMDITYPDKGIKKKFGYNYQTQRIKTWVKSFFKNALRTPSVTTLTVDEKITTSTEIPDFEGEPIKIEFSSWILFSI